MLAMLRVSRTREPFADTLMISPMPLPVNETASLPPWPSTVSLWSPGCQMK